MKQTSCCAVIAFLLAVGASQGSVERYSVVRLTDLRDNASFQVYTDAEKRRFESELVEEAKALPRSIETAQAEWAKALNTDKFPTTRIKARTLKVLNTVFSREEADKLVTQAKLREERRRAQEREGAERALNTQRPRLFGGQRREAQEERKEEQVADRAERLVRQKLSAAVGRDIPFYGAEAEEPKNAGRNRRN